MGFHLRNNLTAIALLFGMNSVPCPAGEKPAPTDIHGDSLPAGAIARLGTSRLQHIGPVHALAYSPDGKWIAAAGTDKAIRFWDAETGKAGFSLQQNEGGITHLAFVPEEEGKPAKVLVSGGFDKTIRFWDLQTRKELAHIINHPGMVTSLAVSQDGKLLASGGDTHVFLWNVKDGKEVRRWQAHRGRVMSLAFTPDGKTIVSGGLAVRESEVEVPKADDPRDNYTVAVWETATGKRRHALADQTLFTRAVAMSADGKFVATAGSENNKGSVVLWDPTTGNKLRAVGDPDETRFFDPLGLALTRDGKTLAVADSIGTRLFDTHTGAEQRGLGNAADHNPVLLAFSPDGRTLATSVGYRSVIQNIMLWDVARRSAKIAAPGHQFPLTSVAVAPDGKTIVTTSFGEPAFLWDRATSKPLRRLQQQDGPRASEAFCAAFAPDGRTIAMSYDGIAFWDAKSGQLQGRTLRRDRQGP